jgi:hypothetical protein
MRSPSVKRGATRWWLLSIAVLLLCAVRGVAAQPHPVLTQSDFDIDLHQGPVLGSTRVVGLGGAYTAVAEEAVGIPFNPAAVAHRTYYSNTRFDWDLGLDFLIPGLFQSSDFDFDNNGRSGSTGSIVWSAGGQIQIGALGFGLYARGQTFEVSSGGSEPRDFPIGLWLLQASVGYALFNHQLVVGGGIRLGIFMVELRGAQLGQNETLFQQNAVGGEAGVIFRPSRWPVRLAASFSSPLSSATPKECTADQCPQGFVMPRGVALPWEVRLGAAYRFGATPFNRTPVLPKKKPKRKPKKKPPGQRPLTEPPEALPAPPEPAAPSEPEPDLDRDYRGGFYVLVSAEVGLTGSVDDAIGTDGFFDQVREQSGQNLSVSPRMGVESEVIRRRLRLRAGTYLEPSRFEDGSGRFHGTFGFDLRLFDFSLFGARSLRFSSSADLASRYSNLLLSLGFWH